MSNFRKQLFRATMDLIRLTNQLMYYFTDGVTVNVVSCNEYKNKIKDDLMLQKYLLKAGYKAKVPRWISAENAVKEKQLRLNSTNTTGSYFGS